MKILSIGNSFSQDAHKYLHRLAAAEGVKLKTVNLYIGGCTLRTHYVNMLEGSDAYGFELNGQQSGIKVSITEALASDDWDVVTLQQASHKSFDKDSYTPYIEALAELVREYCPKAKLMLQRTWAYEDGSAKLAAVGYESAEAMFADVKSAYDAAAELIGADGIIPAGDAMIAAVRGGIGKIHRDTFHASLGAGRYLLALTWYGTLIGSDISENSFSELDEPITAGEREILIAAARTALGL